MDLKLNRNMFRQDGIFGAIHDPTGKQIAVTLEHAYTGLNGWEPLLPDGTYTCLLGEHQLKGMSLPFEAFQIMNVPGHSGILFHIGNYNADSEGCVLLGETVQTDDGIQWITNSRLAFLEFMHLQQGCDEFTIIVSSLC